MMLRRIASHLRSQNWFAVALDLAIVVLGVFVGLQVSNWNEARKDHAAETAALLRLQSEAQHVVAYWSMEVQLQRRHNENRRVFLEVLDEGVMTPAQRPIVDDAVNRLGHYPQFNPPRTVYSELVAAGGLGRISDVEVRDAIAAYAAELDFVMGQLTQFRTNLPTLYDAYDGRIFSVYDPKRPSLRRYEYDIAALAADRQFVSAMVDAVRNQLQFLTIREGILGRALAMCETLSEALSMPCSPSEISEEEVRLRDGVNQ